MKNSPTHEPIYICRLVGRVDIQVPPFLEDTDLSELLDNILLSLEKMSLIGSSHIGRPVTLSIKVQVFEDVH